MFLFPLIFFSLAVGIFELRKENMTLRVLGRGMLYILAATLLLGNNRYCLGGTSCSRPHTHYH